jgi:hypothetical protein
MRMLRVYVVLFNLHANVWWGAMLLVFGLVYCVRFAPRRRHRAWQFIEAAEAAQLSSRLANRRTAGSRSRTLAYSFCDSLEEESPDISQQSYFSASLTFARSFQEINMNP